MAKLIEDRTGDIVRLTLNRPEKKNAIDGELWELLLDSFRRLRDDRSVKVVVITGAGDGFCTGADVSGFGEATDEHPLHAMRRTRDAALALHDLPMPTIAQVNGVAAGAGCNLALGCDLILAGESARFSEIFPRRALSLDFAGSFLLPRLVGLHKAKELAFFGDVISAKEANDIGLVNRVVGDDQLQALVDDWASRLAAGPPLALSQTKYMLNRSLNTTMEEALDVESAAQAINLRTKDMKEATMAFFEKRDARFEGR